MTKSNYFRAITVEKNRITPYCHVKENFLIFLLYKIQMEILAMIFLVNYILERDNIMNCIKDQTTDT